VAFGPARSGTKEGEKEEMACINADGSLTRKAKALLGLVNDPMTPEEISERSGEPLFKVRSSLREMGSAGLIRETGGRHEITQLGSEALSLG
jgi:predicted transcriptional regulator